MADVPYNRQREGVKEKEKGYKYSDAGFQKAKRNSKQSLFLGRCNTCLLFLFLSLYMYLK